ncbi:phage portal protein [Streptosporangium sp. NPDC051022]|uniref:phage portal protein n=1 Tax=Streptosporangium sp. NPDC051022 TaxID=3155752 RepID=UPI00344988EF
MPLPSGGTWPPQHLTPIYQQYAVLDAWYRGDPDELAAIYNDPTRPANRPAQHRGGVVGALARWFWGQPTPQGEKRTKLHVPVASDLAVMSSDLLFSEPPSLTVENTATQERIEELVENGLQATLLEGAEVGAALGGYYLRAVWDTEVAERPWLAVVHADAAVPEWRWGRLSAVTFWRVVEQDDRTFLRHLERHEPGKIFHGLYRGEGGDLGQQIPLASNPATANLQPEVETGIDRLTAVYVPNMRPQREWRNLPAGAPLGRSDFAGPVLGLMDALDEVYTSWMRDVRLAKARLIAPSSYLQSNGPGKGATFDLDRELYEGVNALGDGDRLELNVVQFGIRIVEHRDTGAELLAAILRATGYSAQSFGLSGDVAVTATEVSAKERRSLTTRGKKAVYSGPPLADAVEMLLLLEAALFSSGVEPERPTVVFGDSVSPDLMQLATTAELMRRAEAASDETLVRMLHPDWDETEVKAEVQRIADSRPAQVMDPLALPGEMTGPDDGGGDPAAAQDGPSEGE